MKSLPYNVSGKMFRYDFDNSTVEYIAKAEPEQIESERCWKNVHGGTLYGIGDDGYMVLDTIGLSRTNWEDKETRDEYLAAWAADIDEWVEMMASDFVEHELPHLA